MNAFANYAACLLLIMVSGNPAVRTLGYELNMVTLFGVAVALFLLRRRRLGLSAVRFAVAVAALLFVQVVLWGDVAIFASIGFYLQILSAMLIAAAIPRFPRVVVRTMAAIAAVSLVFYFVVWVPGNLDLVRPLTVYQDNVELNIGIHNFRGYGYEAARNSGPFWEPGAFAGYLAFALFMMVLSRDRSRFTPLIVALLTTALLTTLSTMGYAALFVVIVAALLRSARSMPPVIGLLLLPFVLSTLLISAWTVSEQLPFLKEKVVEQFEETEGEEENTEINRFGNAVFDWSFIVRRPLFGWSASTETRIADQYDAGDIIERQGNALTGMAARFGFVGWLLFMGRFFYNTYRLSGSLPLAAVSIGLIAVMFTGEKYMNYPLIMTLLFLEPYHMAGERVVRVRRLRRVRRTGALANAGAGAR